MLQFNFDCNFNAEKEMNFTFGNIPSRYGANNLYFTKESKPFLPIAGELHFSRLPREKWYRELLKMKDSGLTLVSTYVFWNHHEVEENKFDFSGDKDIAHFLSLCKKAEIPCILRIGPWCHGEVVYGGFPSYIAKLPKKRCDSPKYLSCVERFWKRLCDEVKDYLDGETVFGIQLENEYGGKIDHIFTLRKIAEKVGFKTPFFTMTAWPTNTPDKNFLPMFGGYPEAPWTQNKKPLAPKNRFAISPAKTEIEIGEDLNKMQKGNEVVFDDFPYASCELGPGNQVTQHRRPIIGENDGYGVGFSRFASGMNLIGYYMYHGGRNPNDKPMQESRITGYPNNYPIVNYDFQSPLSRFGECRAHGDRLRLMHLFINTFDDQIAVKQPFFPNEKRSGPNDVSMPSCSLRLDESGSGYFFVSAFERGLEFRDYNDVNVNIKCSDKAFNLPTINIKKNSMFFYPFNLRVGDVTFDYVLAQPITKVEKDGKTVCCFVEIDGISPSLSVGGQSVKLPIDEIGYDENSVQIIVLSKEKAMKLHRADNEIVFAKGTVYKDENHVLCETTNGYLQIGDEKSEATENDLSSFVKLTESAKKKLPYGYYLYSFSKRKYFTLQIDKDILKNRFDVELVFDFSGLNLQLFCGETLIDDYFNTDGKYVLRLREFKDFVEQGGVFTFKTVAPTSFGVGNVYNEIGLEAGSNSLALSSVKEVHLLQQKIG